MGAQLFVVSAPILQLFGRVGKRKKPVGVQALRTDVSVVRWLSRSREVERDALGVGSQIEVAGDELRALIDRDRLRIADPRADLFQRPDHVLCSVTEARVEHRHVARERIDDRQDTDILARRELVVNEVHGPFIVGLDGRLAVVL